MKRMAQLRYVLNHSIAAVFFFVCIVKSMYAGKALLGDNSPKINLYSFYTPSHAVLKDDWFLPSIKDDFNIIVFFADQMCSTGAYRDKGFRETVLKKVDMIIEAAQQNKDKIFIYADIDIQFFKSIQALVEKALVDNDIVVQRDNHKGLICSGFFACRGSDKIIALWQTVKQLMIDEDLDDQPALNKALKQVFKGTIKWDYLPAIFFGTGTLAGKSWLPGKELFVPEGIVMHHANWTKGISNKIALLKYVKNVINARTY